MERDVSYPRWDGLRRHAASPFFQAEVREILALADLGPGMRVLDVGCGNGALVAEASRSRVAIGVDSDLEVVRAATALTDGGTFLRASAERLPFPDSSLDRVFSQHLIEHLGDPLAAVREWARVLRPGGRLVVLTPNARYPDPSIFEDPGHVRIFDRDSLRSLVLDSGLVVLRTKTIFPYLRRHTVFGLRHRQGFSRLPPWRSTGRSLVVAAAKPT